MSQAILAGLLGNAVLLTILAYLAAELRRDVRETRDKVLLMWEWYETTVERRRGDQA